MMPRAAGSVGAVGSVRAAGSVGAVGGARSARRSPGLGRAGPGVRGGHPASGGRGQECAEVTRPRAGGARTNPGQRA